MNEENRFKYLSECADEEEYESQFDYLADDFDPTEIFESRHTFEVYELSKLSKAAANHIHLFSFFNPEQGYYYEIRQTRDTFKKSGKDIVLFKSDFFDSEEDSLNSGLSKLSDYIKY